MNIVEQAIRTRIAHLTEEITEAADRDERLRKEGAVAELWVVLDLIGTPVPARRIDISIIDGRTVLAHTHTDPAGSDEPVVLFSGGHGKVETEAYRKGWRDAMGQANPPTSPRPDVGGGDV